MKNFKEALWKIEKKNIRRHHFFLFKTNEKLTFLRLELAIDQH